VTSAPKALALLCAFEDRAFEDIVLPIIRRVVAESRGWRLEARVIFTHGCDWGALAGIARDYLNWPDVMVVGADTRGESPARKRKSMTPGLKRVLPLRLRDRCILALPAPCAEGWLQADAAALKRGISDVLGRPVSLPAEVGRYPRGEQQAKERLRSLLERSSVPTLRGGLEYGPAIARHVDLSAHTSLREFVRDLRRRLRQSGLPMAV